MLFVFRLVAVVEQCSGHVVHRVGVGWKTFLKEGAARPRADGRVYTAYNVAAAADGAVSMYKEKSKKIPSKESRNSLDPLTKQRNVDSVDRRFCGFVDEKLCSWSSFFMTLFCVNS